MMCFFYCTCVLMRIMRSAMSDDVLFFTAPITAPMHQVQQLQDQSDMRKIQFCLYTYHFKEVLLKDLKTKLYTSF